MARHEVTLKIVPFRWDEEDPTRFIASFGDTDINFDAGFARKLAAALNEMADRIDPERLSQ